MLNFTNKVVVITGASGGICSVCSELFIRQGAKVVNCDFKYPKEDPAVLNFDANPVNIHLDVTNKEEVKEVITCIEEKLGKIDILVNGAGILKSSNFFDVTEEDWDRMLAVNLKGTMLTCQAAIKGMVERKNGVVVNVASVAGKAGSSFSAAEYSASKAGVITLTRSLAKIFGEYGIRVNSVAPGVTESPMIDYYRKTLGEDTVNGWITGTPLKRMGTPLDIGNAILFLASEEASYITGECLNVNGGSLMD